jgi:nicotinamidase-related amidase
MNSVWSETPGATQVSGGTSFPILIWAEDDLARFQPAAAMGHPSLDAATVTVDAKPYAYSFSPTRTALVIIDMQRDFLLPGGFGEQQGSNLTAVGAAIEPTRKLLEACRAAGLAIFHTREGQQPDMSDCPSSKITRQAAMPGSEPKLLIGDKGKMGRLLIRGEYGHDFVDELQPLPGEVVIDKPGKGAFWDTQLMHKLKGFGITHLILSGVTTECCVSTTFREANDRGFECCMFSALPS